MTQQLTHRGPDDSGELYQPWGAGDARGPLPGVALGFRRLSIIDLAGGHQPLSNEDGSVWVIFNGEIYNYRELRHRLEGNGHQFHTSSDTETLVHLYEDEGEDCFDHLNGMFAIAIWDRPRRKLILARDRLGQKPLVYHRSPTRLAFASELKSLRKIPDLPRELCPQAIDEYLTYQYVPYPRTIYRDIFKLPPGHRAVWQMDESFRVEPYWSPDWGHEQAWTRAAAVERLRDLLSDAVRLRMRADVPLGAFLSGGIDSSLIVALMRQHTSQPVKTFSIGFPVAEYNETSYARQVAETLGTDHHEFEVTPNAMQILPELVRQYDEPFADSSAIPTWYVSQMTREHVTVALSGDGGDELFAGYQRYRAVKLADWIDRSAGLRQLLGASFWQKLPASVRQKSFLRRVKRFTSAVRQEPLQRYLEWIGIFNESRRAELYRDDFLKQLPNHDPIEFLEQAEQRIPGRDRVTTISLIDLLTYLPCDLNTKVDQASMAHSLEVRQPFLDRRVVEFAGSLPISLKIHGLRGKQLLRDAFDELLPEAIWTRSKMGFGVPLDHWFRNELRGLTEETLFDPHARCLEYFRSESLRKLWDEHQQRLFDHSYRLWSVLILELWLREWAE